MGAKDTMGWLIGYTLASMVGALIVIRLFDYIFSGLAGGITNAARACLFVITWTAITVVSGLRDFRKRVRQLRQSIGTRRPRDE